MHALWVRGAILNESVKYLHSKRLNAYSYPFTSTRFLKAVIISLQNSAILASSFKGIAKRPRPFLSAEGTADPPFSCFARLEN